MLPRGIVYSIGLMLWYSLIWMASQGSTAEAQGLPEATIYVDRAVIAYEEKRYTEALQELQEASRLDPENIDALYYQGLVYVALNRLAEAQAAWEKARALHPTDLDVAFQLGTLYFSQEQYEPAEPLLRQVYRTEASRPNLGYYLGFIEYRKKNYRRAIDLLQANVPSDENFAQLARFYASLAMSALGFPREAQAEIEEALRLQPISPLVPPTQRFGEVLARAVERERRFFGELRLGFFYDSNVTVVPNASTDIVAQVLRQEQDEPSSSGELGTLSLAYTWLRTLDWEGTASYRFLQTYNNRLPDFNTQSHTPTLGLARRGTLHELPYSTGVQLSYDFITLGDTKFVQRWTVNPYFTLVENAANLTTLHVRLRIDDFFNDRELLRVDRKAEVRDAVNFMVGPLHFLLFDEGRHYIKLGYQYDSNVAEGDDWDYSGHRVLFGTQYTLPWAAVRLRYDLDFHLRFHTNKHSLIPVTAPGTIRRHDREAVHLFSVSKDFTYKAQSFTVSLEYLLDDNTSNLEAFDYDRNVVTTSLTWRF